MVNLVLELSTISIDLGVFNLNDCLEILHFLFLDGISAKCERVKN